MYLSIPLALLTLTATAQSTPPTTTPYDENHRPTTAIQCLDAILIDIHRGMLTENTRGAFMGLCLLQVPRKTWSGLDNKTGSTAFTDSNGLIYARHLSLAVITEGLAEAAARAKEPTTALECLERTLMDGRLGILGNNLEQESYFGICLTTVPETTWTMLEPYQNHDRMFTDRLGRTYGAILVGNMAANGPGFARAAQNWDRAEAAVP
jgi:hypothetical protein